MFSIGTVNTKKFSIRIVPSPLELLENKHYLTEEMKKQVAPYCKTYFDYKRKFFLCQVLLTDKKIGSSYVDLNKSADFPCVSFKEAPKKEDAYQTEYRYYQSVKDHPSPMIYLHRDTLEKVLDRCVELSSNGKDQ